MNPGPKELVAFGYEARRPGHFQDAKTCFSQAVKLCREEDNRSVLASALAGLGQIERDLKNISAAIEHYREAAEILRADPDQLRFAHTIRHLGDILRGEGSMDEAGACYEEALRIYRSQGETSALDLANAIRGFALLRGAVGEIEESKLLWEEARGLYESVNVEAGVLESERQIARLSVKNDHSP